MTHSCGSWLAYWLMFSRDIARLMQYNNRELKPFTLMSENWVYRHVFFFPAQMTNQMEKMRFILTINILGYPIFRLTHIANLLGYPLVN